MRARLRRISRSLRPPWCKRLRDALLGSLLLACALGLAAQPLGAQDQETARPEPDDDRAASENEPARDEEPPASPDRFDPSEEISLDLPVSFPVDI